MKPVFSHFITRLFYKKAKNTPLVVYGLPKISVALCCFYILTQKVAMKILYESIRNFCAGFVSFYTLLYKELKSW